jgi:hypothetical protein
MTREAGFAIVARDFLIIDDRPMSGYTAGKSPKSNVVHASYLSLLLIQWLLADLLAMGQAGWSRAHREIEEWQLTDGEP